MTNDERAECRKGVQIALSRLPPGLAEAITPAINHVPLSGEVEEYAQESHERLMTPASAICAS